MISVLSFPTFTTLSLIPGYMQWLLPKFASAERPGSTFRENLLKPEEEKAVLDASLCFAALASADVSPNPAPLFFNMHNHIHSPEN
ncbi:hypothetical protein ACH5RR_014758 [Cinchona calisaya]|uniref:Uncharacterized protein n=1 Tax=Cinchona calisaya TaxID=153742 RepID=A0ABD2ZR70_9GENT